MSTPSRLTVAPVLLSLALARCGDPPATTTETSTLTTQAPPPDGSSSTTQAPTPTTGGTSTGAVDPTTAGESSTSTTDAIKYDVGVKEDVPEEGCVPEETDAVLTGTVYAPNLVIPVSGALVYASATAPEGVPDHVYCAECVKLPCDTPYTLSQADGSFSLPVPSGARYIVVQKGQFMRVTEVDVAPGDNPLAVEVTSLPDHRDPQSGLYIPNIALALGEFDRLEDALAKLGLADTDIDMNSYTETYVPGTEQFDMWDNTTFPMYPTLGTIEQLVLDYSKLEKYHILFVPCSNDPYIQSMFGDVAKDNVRKWVSEGGRFYVADWSNEYLFAGFGQYQTFHKNKNYGGTDLGSPYDSLGTVLDADLLAWLQALPAALKNINPQNGGGFDHPTIDALPQIETVDNWSGVLATPKILVDDGMGGKVDVGHKIWIEGPGDGVNVPVEPQPLTITAQYGCGKIMFTTYHMAEFLDSYIGLTPQELVLLYLILEIGVCQEAFEPPPPPD
jgi:hypothetical protein